MQGIINVLYQNW